MSSLRKAYVDQKNYHNDIISESAMKWLKGNVIVINEKIDRKTVNRLIDSITKFEDTFGPFKEKLPAIAKYLDDAEQSLNMVITGRVSDRKTSNMLEQLGYLYSTFSNFFTRDLPVLLPAKLFKSAKENPGQAIASLENFDSQTTLEALTNAIKPSAEERHLLNKIYRGATLPKINAREIARQMLNLTYEDLEALTTIGKVPMVVADSGNDLGLPESVGHQNKNIIEEKAQYITPDIAEQIIDKARQILVNEEKALYENQVLLEINTSEIAPSINAIKKVVDSAEVLAPLKGPVGDLNTKVLQALDDGSVKSYLAQVGASKNPAQILKNLFSTPQGTIISQANMAIETLKNVASVWGDISAFLNKENPSNEDIVRTKSILTKKIKGGILQKLTSSFKTQPFPGLSPDDILNVLFAPLDEYLQNSKANESVQNDSKNIILEQTDALAALEKFKTGMTQLNTALKGGKSSGTKTTAASSAPAAATPASETQTAAPTSGTTKGQPGAPAGDDDSETTAAITASFAGKLKPEVVAQLSKGLASKGYKIVKK